MKNKLISLCPVIFSLVMVGCATTKITPEIRQQINQTEEILKKTPVAILTNTCFLTNEVGRDQILVLPSQQSAEKFNLILKQELNHQGIQVSNTATPLICGYIPEEQFKKYDLKVNEKEKRTATTTYPLQNSSEQSLNIEQQNAVVLFNQFSVAMTQIEGYNLTHKKSPKPLPILSDETVSTLKEWSQSRYLISADLDGLDATIGHKFAMGALSTGVALATLNTGSSLITTYLPREGQSYRLRLFDLEKKEFVWYKEGILQGNVFSHKNHSLSAKNVLDPLFKPSSD